MRDSKSLFLFLFFIFISLTFIFGIYALERSYVSEVGVLPFTILRETYNSDTTNFSGYNESEYRNFSSVVLEKSTYGMIEFEENLDLITMAGSDWIVDFDYSIEISDNLITVDEYNLSGIQKSAVLSLYGISYTNPEIHHNGVVCADCEFINYAGGVYKFRTPSFSGVYYLRETEIPPFCGDGNCDSGEDYNNCPADCDAPVTPPSDTPPGGGGDIPIEPVDSSKYNFYVDPVFFDAELGKGTYYQKIITITNNGTEDLSISIGISGVQNYVFTETRSFILAANETRDLRFDIYASYARAADVYVGKISFFSTHLTRETEVVLNVLERDALFDIRTVVLKKYVNPGGRARANITLINMGDLRNFDVSLEYKVMDFNKNEYTWKKEDFAIDKYYTGEFYLDLPKNITIGNYLFYSKVSYGNVNASSYDTFIVERVSTFTWILLIIIIILAIYLMLRIYLDNRHKIFILIGDKKKKKEEDEKKKSLLPAEVPKLPDKMLE